MEKIPNPGSEEAIKQGCKCPVMDNHHGEGMPYPGGPAFHIAGDCELHNPKEGYDVIPDETLVEPFEIVWENPVAIGFDEKTEETGRLS